VCPAARDNTIEIDIHRPRPCPFTEIYHNDDPFVPTLVSTLPFGGKRVLICESCKCLFSKHCAPPCDIVLVHKERHLYPKFENGSFQQIPTLKKLVTRYYCLNIKCLLQRHPHFWTGLLQRPSLDEFGQGRVQHFQSIFKL
jgi:hypothetical protein